jgi:hypothetical protein
MELTNTVGGSTLMYAIDDTAAGHNVPSMPMGQTEDGHTIMAKAVFADEESATLMANHMDKQPGAHPGRFQVVPVEVWRPTDIEILIRERIREAKKGEGPKLILPGSM